MTVEISSSEQMRAIRGSALKQARKASGLSAERLAQFVNDRTVGSDLTRHAIYSYEQGKVLLSREVGHRIATALQLHPGKLLLGDPEYAPPGSTPGSAPGSNHSATRSVHPADAADHAIEGFDLRSTSSADPHPHDPTDTSGDISGGVAVALRVELVVNAQRTLAPAQVLVRLLRKAKLGRIDIAGYLDVFHLLLEDTHPLTRSTALLEIHDFGDQPGNEAPFALAEAIMKLHELAEAILKRLIDSAHDSPTSAYDYCQAQTESLAALTQTVRGEIDACNKRLPGVSVDED